MTAPQDVVVVDASLAAKWVLAEHDSDTASDPLDEWVATSVQPIVPSWFACEVANILYQFVKAGELTVEEAQRKIHEVMESVAVFGDEPDDAVRALGIAAEIGHQACYDAQYIALAERLGCEVWTADNRFRLKVQASHPLMRSLKERG